MHHQAAPKALPPPPHVLHLPTPLTAGTTSNICFDCGHTDHFARDCTALKKNTAHGHINHPPHGQQKDIATRTDQVNYATMEDIPKGKHVHAGTFSLNGYPHHHSL
jgi:hypothetical protein